MEKITASSGNVFEDLGFAPNEAAHLKIRALLLIALEKAISARNLSQAAVAKELGLHQSRISDIKRHKVESFSADKLIDLLATIGQTVEVTVSEPTAAKRRTKAKSAAMATA